MNLKPNKAVKSGTMIMNNKVVARTVVSIIANGISATGNAIFDSGKFRVLNDRVVLSSMNPKECADYLFGFWQMNMYEVIITEVASEQRYFYTSIYH